MRILIDIDTLTEKDRALNLGALNAVLGFSTDWRRELAALLRSDAPIIYAVRNELADIIEGKSSLSITLKGHDKSSKRIDGLNARRGWFEDGKKVSQLVEGCDSVDDAFEAATSIIGRDSDYCRKKYYYYKHCSEWIAGARRSGRFYPTMEDQELADVWHFAAFDQKRDRPTPPTANLFDEIRIQRLRFLMTLFDKEQPMERLAINLFTYMSELYPPSNG